MQTLTASGTGDRTSVGYDAKGRERSFIDPTGLTVSYSYTATGFLSQLSNYATGASLYQVNARDAALNITKTTHGNGVVTTNSYDPNMHRLTDIFATLPNAPANVESLHYAYDRLGNLTQRIDSDDSLTETFQYDVLNRLNQASSSSPASAQPLIAGAGYDAAGNITSKSGVGSYSSFNMEASITLGGRPHPFPWSSPQFARRRRGRNT